MRQVTRFFWVVLLMLVAGNASAQIPEGWRFPEKYTSLVEFLADSLPDLHDIKIKVKEKPIGTTMAMRPAFGSFFKKPEKRTYVLCINSKENFSGVLYDDVPPEARVGLVVHEFMHIRDYQDRNFFGLLERGWQYLSKKGKRKFEFEIDQMVIEAGFGFFLYAWSSYVIDKSGVDEKYLEFKKEVYMGPHDILTEINQIGDGEILNL
ncbi:hypothetical protein [Marinilabilia rubra]|uniref:hypothetical protein n=1 Tax=Marinilabilia rubra TaxID=2162893 RepID=UPI0018E068F8|nr:hypothetical protein [Marinilabilia rubra]